ncbi:MAG: hypothetical protein RMK45_00670 [Armatimonadota bacterium]|nr:hypothetical protein [Armatimonadota bacterium]
MASVRSRRGWLWLSFGAWLLVQSAGAGALFWGLFPLWLGLFWTVQGYPPVWSDFAHWYALGAFNAAPASAMLLLSPLVIGGLLVALRSRRAPKLIPPLIYGLLAPPLAYALLLVYAEMWQYRAWDAMMPNLLRAYLLLAPACALVGVLLGRIQPPYRHTPRIFRDAKRL